MSCLDKKADFPPYEKQRKIHHWCHTITSSAVQNITHWIWHRMFSLLQDLSLLSFSWMHRTYSFPDPFQTILWKSFDLQQTSGCLLYLEKNIHVPFNFSPILPFVISVTKLSDLLQKDNNGYLNWYQLKLYPLNKESNILVPTIVSCSPWPPVAPMKSRVSI